jgi:hypothetical protein
VPQELAWAYQSGSVSAESAIATHPDGALFRRNPSGVPLRPCKFVHAIARGGAAEIDQFSKLRAEGADTGVITIARLVDEGIAAIDVGSWRGVPRLEVRRRDSKRALPTQVCGDGLRRTLGFTLAAHMCRGGMLLVEEIDAGIHHSVQAKLFSEIATLVRQLDVQVFATTHSRECVAATVRAFAGTPEDFKEIRLERIDGKIEALVLPHDAVAAALDLGMEVR